LILLFYAFAREIAPFKRRLENRRAIEHRDLRGFRAGRGETEILAIATGMGLARARRTARRAFELYPDAELAIGTGVAGALTDGLGPGDLVLADRVMVQHDAVTEPEHLVTIDGELLVELGGRLAAAGLRFAMGGMFSSQRVLSRGVEKRLARKKTGAIAVDMETASIAEQASARGISFTCLRAIIDQVDEEVVGATLTDRSGEVSALAATAYLLRNPGDLLKLPRMMTNLGRASRSLAGGLEAILPRNRART
jgi:adenosylhomocysteine nucleosidase